MRVKEDYFTHPGLKADKGNLPAHVAIIMDGNGRWAKARGLTRTVGHRRGVDAAREIISACQQKKIAVLTLFAFGIENRKRPAKEVRNLFRLFFLVLRKDIFRLHENNIRVRVIGDNQMFNSALVGAITNAEHLTQSNTGLVLNIAVNYSGRWDLLNAIQKLYHKTKQGLEISETMLSQELCLQGLPEPDLFIRTGGVQRVSNFILWELAYTELFFTATLWPEFSAQEFELALDDYKSRERRFGLTGEQL